MGHSFLIRNRGFPGSKTIRVVVSEQLGTFGYHGGFGFLDGGEHSEIVFLAVVPNDGLPPILLTLILPGIWEHATHSGF